MLSGCATAEFYRQAASGHISLTLKKKRIDKLIASEDTSAELREKLQTVQRIRQFAVDELQLPDNGSYTQYVDLKRDAVVWIVTAAPEFSVVPKSWCFPIAGCVSYRGYFSENGAEKFADHLSRQSFETAITPGLAYSTLGWQKDPILSTMLNRNELGLAGVIFHELAHQQLYVKDDTAFNEGYASAVESIGRQRWARANGLLDQLQSEHQRRAANRIYQSDFNELVLTTRDDLNQIYIQPVSDQQKRQQKLARFEQLQEDYQHLKRRWDGYTGYDDWFAPPGPNNADLALISAYQSNKPAFLAIYLQQNCDLSRFYQTIETLSRRPAADRNQKLAEALQQTGDQALDNLTSACTKIAQTNPGSSALSD